MSDYSESLKKLPLSWKICRYKDIYHSIKEVAGDKANDYDRLALTMGGVIKRSKEDDKGLQPADFKSYQILRKDDMVFKMIDLQNISTSRVGRTQWEGLVSPAYLRFEPKYEDPGFMYYYFMSLYYRNVFNNIAGDGVRSALNSTDIGNIICPYPPLNEQQSIVDTLDKKISQIDKLISNQEKQIEKLNEYKQSIITKAVTKGLDPNVEMKDSGVEWIGKIPQYWSRDKVVRIFKIIGSGTTPKDDSYLIDGSINWIQSGDINGGILSSCSNKISNKAIEFYSALTVYKHPYIIMAMYGGSVGHLSLSQIDGCVNQACCVLKDPYLNYFYTFYCLNSAKNHLLKHAIGGGQPNISQTIIKQSWFPKPPEK